MAGERPSDKKSVYRLMMETPSIQFMAPLTPEEASRPFVELLEELAQSLPDAKEERFHLRFQRGTGKTSRRSAPRRPSKAGRAAH
jgi:hypothetical protein